MINKVSRILIVVGIIISMVLIGVFLVKFITKVSNALNKSKTLIRVVEIPVPSINMNQQSVLSALTVTLIIFGIMLYIAYDLYQITQDNCWQPSIESSKY